MASTPRMFSFDRQYKNNRSKLWERLATVTVFDIKNFNVIYKQSLLFSVPWEGESWYEIGYENNKFYFRYICHPK